jgi:hypothetical protein
VRAYTVAAKYFDDDLRGQLSEERFVLVVATTQNLPNELKIAPSQRADLSKNALVLGSDELLAAYGSSMSWICAPRAS